MELGQSASRVVYSRASLGCGGLSGAERVAVASSRLWEEEDATAIGLLVMLLSVVLLPTACDVTASP